MACRTRGRPAAGAARAPHSSFDALSRSIRIEAAAESRSCGSIFASRSRPSRAGITPRVENRTGEAGAAGPGRISAGPSAPSPRRSSPRYQPAQLSCRCRAAAARGVCSGLSGMFSILAQAGTAHGRSASPLGSPYPPHAAGRASALAKVRHARDHAMSAPWARDGEPDLACALALVGREALGANRDGRAHITTSRVIVTWNHIEIGIGGEASITAGAMPAVLGQIGFVGAVVEHGPLWVIEGGAVGISSIRNALECKLAPALMRE
jgi:hypothetical protein